MDTSASLTALSPAPKVLSHAQQACLTTAVPTQMCAPAFPTPATHWYTPALQSALSRHAKMGLPAIMVLTSMVVTSVTIVFPAPRAVLPFQLVLQSALKRKSYALFPLTRPVAHPQPSIVWRPPSSTQLTLPPVAQHTVHLLATVERCSSPWERTRRAVHWVKFVSPRLMPLAHHVLQWSMKLNPEPSTSCLQETAHGYLENLARVQPPRVQCHLMATMRWVLIKL